jgi:UDP-glucose 4-epimerase
MCDLAMSKTILVTGSRGVIGSKLCKRLIEKGYEVLGTRREGQEPQTKQKEFVIKPWKEINLGHIVPDFIIHLAGSYSTKMDNSSIRNTLDSNVGLATSLATLTRNFQIPIIAAGTFMEKYPGPEGISYYAASKISSKDVLLQATALGGSSFHYVYLYDTYSLDTRRNKFVDLLWNHKPGDQPLLASAGSQIQDLVYLDDVVEGLSGLLRDVNSHKSDFQEWQIRTNRALSLRQIASKIENCRKIELNILWGSLPYRFRESFSLWDCAKNIQILEPLLTFEQGLNLMLSESTL